MEDIDSSCSYIVIFLCVKVHIRWLMKSPGVVWFFLGGGSSFLTVFKHKQVQKEIMRDRKETIHLHLTRKAAKCPSKPKDDVLPAQFRYVTSSSHARSWQDLGLISLSNCLAILLIFHLSDFCIETISRHSRLLSSLSN